MRLVAVPVYDNEITTDETKTSAADLETQNNGTVEETNNKPNKIPLAFFEETKSQIDEAIKEI